MSAPLHSRPYNFSAGPAALPLPVLERAAQEMCNWHSSGMGVMEMSHRGREFQSIYDSAEAALRRLLGVPSHFKILFMQGGGLAENAIVPLNLSRGGVVDFVVSGAWSQKSYREAAKYCQAHLAASGEESGFTALPAPESWRLSQNPNYVHLCSNETIHGIECHDLPDLGALGCSAPLVIDCSSHILSRPMDWSKIGLAYAGAQKNIGPAGLTIVVVREDLLDQALEICPSAFHYRTVAQHGSMYNTPPTYAIYIAGLVFAWLEEQGGVAAMEVQNKAKADLLYGFLDRSSLFTTYVARENRSRMNVPFFIKDASGQPILDAEHPLNAAFLNFAKEQGLLQLKGHKSVGGLRASIYNAMPLAGVQALLGCMQEFEASR